MAPPLSTSKHEIKTSLTQPLTHDTDVLIICPTAPEFLIAGTYSLLRKTDQPSYSGQVRHGMIRILRVNPLWKPTFPGQLMPVLAKRTFPAAVLDAHFHPKDPTLLGVALSNAEVHFFRFVKRYTVLDRRVVTELLPLGCVKVAEKDQYGLIPLVTQFRWLEFHEERGFKREGTDVITVVLVAATSSYEVRTVKLKLPGIKSTFDPRLAHKAAAVDGTSEVVNVHENEAWTVAAIPVGEEAALSTVRVLSGADDCRLGAVTVYLDTSTHPSEHSTSPATPLWTDSKSHSYGVTAILPLPPPLPTTLSENPPPIPLLTGSYDEHLRLFTLNPHTHRRDPLQPVVDLNLGGGVWRIMLMDWYIIPQSSPAIPPADIPPNQNLHSDQETTIVPPHETHYLLLIPAMHNGVRIVRLVHTPSPTETSSHWTAALVASFSQGHATLVYAATSSRAWWSPYYDHNNHSEDDPPGATLVADDHSNGTWPAAISEAVHTRLSTARDIVGGKRKIRVDLPWLTAPPPAPSGVGNASAGDSAISVRKGEKHATASKAAQQGEARKDGRKDWRGKLDYQQRKEWEDTVGTHQIASCGFYDRNLCTWTFRDGLRCGGLDVLEFLEGLESENA